MVTKCYERYSINNLYNVIMAWPRNGIVVDNDITKPSLGGACLTPAPTASCTTIGGPGGGSGGAGGGGTGGAGGSGTGAGGIDNTVVAATLYTNMNVGYFKINLEETKTNMYGESLEKWYFSGVNVRCTIDRGVIANTLDEFGVDLTNTITVNIPRALLQSYNFMPEVGDLVFDREKYYEVNSIDSQFITMPGTGASNGNLGTAGQVITYVLICHLTRTTKLNIIPYYQ
jgi:hypothetical protein